MGLPLAIAPNACDAVDCEISKAGHDVMEESGVSGQAKSREGIELCIEEQRKANVTS